MANFHVDSEDKTFLYILYIDSICAADGSEMNPSDVVVRWYVDDENDCSDKFYMDASNPANPRYCAFMVASFANVSSRSGKQATICLSVGDEHLAAAFLDIGDFSTEEAFKDATVELQNASGILANAELHTAAQKRWSTTAEVVAQDKVYFVNPKTDGQAEYLYQHIVADVSGEAADTSNAAAEAETERQRLEQEESARKRAEVEASQRREAEEQKRKQDAEAEEQKRASRVASREAEMESQRREQEEEDRRRREDERRKQREAEELEKERQIQVETDREKEQEEQRLRDDEDRQRREDEENERRRNEELDREKDMRRRNSSRWAEDERKRQAEEDRWRQRQREREEEAKERQRREEEAERWQASRASELRKLEEERERLRQDAKRERTREAAERERRAQERKKNAENTAALLGADGGGGPGDSLSSNAPTKQGSRGPSPGAHTFVPDSRGSSPKRRSGNLSASAGSPQRSYQHSPQDTKHFGRAAAENDEHRNAYLEQRAVFTEQPPQTYVQHQHLAAEPPRPESARANASTRWPPAGTETGVSGLSVDGYDSEGSNPFEGDMLAEEEEVYHQPAHSVRERPAPVFHLHRERCGRWQRALLPKAVLQRVAWPGTGMCRRRCDWNT